MEATNRKWRVAQSHKYCEKGKGAGGSDHKKCWVMGT